jgi:hypothetical protein
MLESSFISHHRARENGTNPPSHMTHGDIFLSLFFCGYGNSAGSAYVFVFCVIVGLLFLAVNLNPTVVVRTLHTHSTL